MGGPATRAFDRIVAENGGVVLRLCRSILRDEHLGRDAAQETFLRLWRRALEGRLPALPTGWLRKVAVSTSLDMVRSTRSRAQILERHGLSVAESRLADTESEPERELTAAELRLRLDACIERLSEGQRCIFLLRHEGGLGLREIAATLDLALPTVKTQFARACLKLQACLAIPSPRGEAR